MQLKTRLMLQMPVHLKKLSTCQDSRCGVKEKEGILRAGNLIKNVQNKRPEGRAWSSFLSLWASCLTGRVLPKFVLRGKQEQGGESSTETGSLGVTPVFS